MLDYFVKYFMSNIVVCQIVNKRLQIHYSLFGVDINESVP